MGPIDIEEMNCNGLVCNTETMFLNKKAALSIILNFVISEILLNDKPKLPVYKNVIFLFYHFDCVSNPFDNNEVNCSM